MLRAIRLPSLPTPTKMPARRAPTIRLSLKVFSREPTPPYHHSTLIPAGEPVTTLRAIVELFVACSR